MKNSLSMYLWRNLALLKLSLWLVIFSSQSAVLPAALPDGAEKPAAKIGPWAVLHATKSRPHTCSDCWAAFTKRCHLTEHMRTHTSEKPYICTGCGAAFAQCSALTRHLRTHTGEKPYICTGCGAAFAAPYPLT